MTANQLSNGACFISYRGLPALSVSSPDGSHAVILLQGAQVLSWQRSNGQEVLFLSERAAFSAGQPVRGGIPVIFPQFENLGPLPRHGFARTANWALKHTTTSKDDALAVLEWEQNETTLALWPHTFKAELTVRLSALRLDIELAIDNSGMHSFEFSAALHTYLRVAGLDTVHLDGLQRLRYQDSVLRTEKVQPAERLQVFGEMDRIYFDASRELILTDAQTHLRISMVGFKDVVVWNPGPQRSAAMQDMSPQGYNHMLCVEAAIIAEPVQLAAGAQWVGRQSLEVVEPDTPES